MKPQKDKYEVFLLLFLIFGQISMNVPAARVKMAPRVTTLWIPTRVHVCKGTRGPIVRRVNRYYITTIYTQLKKKRTNYTHKKVKLHSFLIAGIHGGCG